MIFLEIFEADRMQAKYGVFEVKKKDPSSAENRVAVDVIVI